MDTSKFNKKIIVTGGMGYIGSHTVVDLILKGYDVISIDNLSRSSKFIPDGIKKITGKTIKNYPIDLCNYEELRRVFYENQDCLGIIHFAAYKDVLESVKNPLLYYHNNLFSTINIIKCLEEFNILHFIFSSSCTVYGNISELAVTEETPLNKPLCPYGYTKQMCENIIKDFSQTTKTKFILLRYFNPAGAHISENLGEYLHHSGNHLVPVLNQVAAGVRKELIVHGNDYPTRDGTGVRDFIHVMDIAEAHTLALEFLLHENLKNNIDIYNLGTGEGITVLEAINAFEKANNIKLNWCFGPRREGDIVSIYASNEKAKNILGWNPKYTLNDIMRTAWNWQKKLTK